MKNLLLTSSAIVALFAVAACNPDSSSNTSESGEVQTTIDGGVIEPDADAATEAEAPMEDEQPEVDGEADAPVENEQPAVDGETGASDDTTNAN